MANKPDIYVDADACPVKDEVLRVAERHGLAVYMVSNSGGRAGLHPLVRLIVVPPDPDAADDWIAERIGAGDIAVTGDILLAARCLETGAQVLAHDGKPFDDASIGMALAMRDLNRHLRETGDISGAGRGFAKADRSRFSQALEAAVRKVEGVG